jgi:hypothetical protein
MLLRGNSLQDPELIEKEKKGDGIQGELNLSGKIVQSDLEVEEWRELPLDYIHPHRRCGRY